MAVIPGDVRLEHSAGRGVGDHAFDQSTVHHPNPAAIAQGCPVVRACPHRVPPMSPGRLERVWTGGFLEWEAGRDRFLSPRFALRFQGDYLAQTIRIWYFKLASIRGEETPARAATLPRK